MHFAYVDESGDSGPQGSRTYTLACVLVQDQAWPSTFDDLIDFRRFLRDRYKIPVRAEIKANYLVRGGGPLRPLKLSAGARFAVYRAHMRIQSSLGVRTFAVVIKKKEFWSRHSEGDPRKVAWEHLLNRLERFTAKEPSTVLIVHDEGENLLVRAIARKARRAGIAGSAFGTGILKRPATLVLDDPVPRSSQSSYFLQLADLSAYAAYRRLYPPPEHIPSPIVPQAMWDEIGDAIHTQANYLAGGPPGIPSYP